MFSFQHTEYLAGIIILVPFVLFFLNTIFWKQKVIKKFGDESLIRKLTAAYSSKRYALKFLLVCLSAVCICIAAANLRFPSASKESDKAGIDIMIAFDVSKSMWAEDIKPSRLDFTKNLLARLVDKLNENRIGLVVFAGKSFLQVPLTNDAGIIKMCLSNASPDAVPVQGTVISDALQRCNNSFNAQDKKYKSIILISDGEDHDEHTDAMLQQLSDAGVIVNTIGIGTVQGTAFTEPGMNMYKTDINGQTVISKLNEDELKMISAKTGGEYINAGSDIEKTTNDVYANISSMEKKLLQGDGGAKAYTSLSPVFIILALIFLLSEIFISETKRIKQ